MSNNQELPKEWTRASLEEICTAPQYGWTTKATDSGAFRLLRTTDISSGRVNWDSVPYCFEVPKNPKLYYLKAGDIVVSRAGSVGKSFLIKENVEGAVFASYLVRFKPLIESEYIYYFMQSRNYWSQIEDNTAGIAVPNVNASKLSKLQLPLAPLAEQRRIVSKIEELFSDIDAGEANLRKAQKLIATYRQSVLKAAVTGELTRDWRTANTHRLESGAQLLDRILAARRAQWQGRGKYREPQPPDTRDLPDLPEGWSAATVDQLSVTIEYGSSAKCSTEAGGVAVLRMGNIVQGQLSLDELKYLPADHDEFPKLLLIKGDILFNRTNSAELVGKTAIYEGKPEVCSFASYLIRVRSIIVEPRFVIAFINSAFGRAWIKRVVSQQVGQANVNGSKLRALTIPLPPIEEQQEIVNRMDDLFSRIDALETWCRTELARSATLRQSILKAAFSGQLVPQDPNDEPASVLLERIRAERTGQPPKHNRHKPRQMELF